MKRVVILPPAETDLEEIGLYTLESWGWAQMERYLERLYNRFDALAARPESGRKCDTIRQGYSRCSEGRHVVFYTVHEDHIEIARVLHSQMDFEQHL